MSSLINVVLEGNKNLTLLSESGLWKLANLKSLTLKNLHNVEGNVYRYRLFGDPVMYIYHHAITRCCVLIDVFITPTALPKETGNLSSLTDLVLEGNDHLSLPANSGLWSLAKLESFNLVNHIDKIEGNYFSDTV